MTLGEVVFGFSVAGFGLGGGGREGTGQGQEEIAELKVKINQQSFKDMPTQKKGSEEDT